MRLKGAVHPSFGHDSAVDAMKSTTSKLAVSRLKQTTLTLATAKCRCAQGFKVVLWLSDFRIISYILIFAHV